MDQNQFQQEINDTFIDMIACERILMIKFLIDNGAQINKLGGEALHFSLAYSAVNIQLIKLLLSYVDDFIINNDIAGKIITDTIQTDNYEIAKLIWNTHIVFYKFSLNEYAFFIKYSINRLLQVHLLKNNISTGCYYYNYTIKLVNEHNIIKIFELVSSFFENSVDMGKIIKDAFRDFLVDDSGLWFAKKDFFDHVSKYFIINDLLDEKYIKVKLNKYHKLYSNETTTSYLYQFFTENDVSIEFNYEEEVD